MSSNERSTKYLIDLSPEQSECLGRVVERRRMLDNSVSAEDVILEAVDAHLDRLGRPPRVKRDGRPDRSATLYDHLFGRDAETAFDRLSAGIIAVIDNVNGLLEDASVLVEAKRFDRAEFLIATAQEEMGKAYILLDMCRVDPARQQHTLRHLCNSFYDHVLKHVYFDLSANKYAGLSTLLDVQRHFRISAKEFSPSSRDSGEPNMPHDTFFLREANLYVGVDSYSGTWMVPRLPSKVLLFEATFLGTPLDSARGALQKFREAHEVGLLSPNALQVFNRAMKSLKVSERTNVGELLDAYKRAGGDLEAHRIPPKALKESTLHNWPMYWIQR